MKKFLLTTTAIVATGLLAGQALAADKPTVSVGGFTQYNYYATSESSTSGTHGLQADDSEIIITATGKADNGLEYGVKIEKEADVDNTGSDENVLWISGSWGKVEIGSEDGAADRLVVTAPAGWGDGGADSDYTDVSSNQTFGGILYSADETDDANKISYFGSSGAISFGASFAPSSTTEGDESLEQTGGYNNAVELGVNYSGEASGMSYTVGLVGAFGDSDDTTKEDMGTYQVGVSVTSGSWTVGAHYADNGDTGETIGSAKDKTVWAIGAQYTTGPWTVGAHYTDAEYGSDDSKVWSAGFTYAVAPGLAIGGEVVSWDETVSSTSKDGEVFTLLTAVSF